MPPVTAYCSVDQLQNIGVNAAALSKAQYTEKVAAIESASRTIDGYIQRTFTLPLLVVGSDIGRAAAIIAAYDLVSGRGFNPEAGADKNLRDRYLDIIKWLTGIANGDLVPVGTVDSSVTAIEPAAARVISANSRGFSVRGTGQLRGPFQGD